MEEIKYETSGFSNLGRKITISPKSNLFINKPGYNSTYHVPTVELIIGIGKNHTASLVMTTDAWDALNDNEEIHISTAKEYSKQYIYRKSKNK